MPGRPRHPPGGLSDHILNRRVGRGAAGIGLDGAIPSRAAERSDRSGELNHVPFPGPRTPSFFSAGRAGGILLGMDRQVGVRSTTRQRPRRVWLSATVLFIVLAAYARSLFICDWIIVRVGTVTVGGIFVSGRICLFESEDDSYARAMSKNVTWGACNAWAWSWMNPGVASHLGWDKLPLYRHSTTVPVACRPVAGGGESLEYCGTFAYTLHVPYFVITAVCGALLFVQLRRAALHRRAEDRRLAGLCPACGYDLRASHERCPECGTPIPADLVRHPLM